MRTSYVQLGVQAAGIPFFTRRLDAVRCALRQAASIMTVFGTPFATDSCSIMRSKTPRPPTAPVVAMQIGQSNANCLDLARVNAISGPPCTPVHHISDIEWVMTGDESGAPLFGS